MTTATPAPGQYAIDVPSSVVTFTTRHLFGMGKVHGSVRLRGGTISLAEPLTRSRVDAVADAASFDTGNRNRNRQVLSKALLDTAAYPDITFTSTGAELDRAGALALQGRLSAHGVRAPLTFTVAQAQVDGDEITVVATATVDRYAHGVTKLKGMAAQHLELTATIRAHRATGGADPLG